MQKGAPIQACNPIDPQRPLNMTAAELQTYSQAGEWFQHAPDAATTALALTERRERMHWLPPCSPPTRERPVHMVSF